MSRDVVPYTQSLKVACFLASIKNERCAHFHNEMEVIYVFKGSVRVQLRNENITLQENDILFLERNVVHSIYSTDKANELYCIMFDPAILGSISTEFQNIRFYKHHITQNDPELYGTVKQLFLSILEEFKERKKSYAIRVVGALCYLCAELMDKLEGSLVEQNEDDIVLARLTRVINYINENFTQTITLKDLAKEENLDVAYLSHFIKKHLGTSFQKYLIQARLERAEWLITSTDLKLTDISVESGFSDYRYLCNAFYAKYGKTPSQYRQEYQNVRYRSQRTTNSKKIIENVLSQYDADINGIIRYFGK